jgi:hypothetical protein
MAGSRQSGSRNHCSPSGGFRPKADVQVLQFLGDLTTLDGFLSSISQALGEAVHIRIEQFAKAALKAYF